MVGLGLLEARVTCEALLAEPPPPETGHSHGGGPAIVLLAALRGLEALARDGDAAARAVLERTALHHPVRGARALAVQALLDGAADPAAQRARLGAVLDPGDHSMLAFHRPLR